jgi:ElaB/YqjD/DUF883 family membrane-anchored ribosome-binding protein
MSILSHAQAETSKEKIHEASQDIAHEFKSFVSDVEHLIKETASLTGDDLARAKAKLNQRIQSAKQSISNASGNIADQARKTATATNKYVHENPWTIIGVGALASFVLGAAIGYRRDSDK